ncbi:MAG: hypothetical protein Fur0010_08180 [Bdellovibrio sp.]
MNKFQWFFPKVILLLGLIIIAGAASGCTTNSLATGVGEKKSPHQDESSTGRKTASQNAPFNFMR